MALKLASSQVPATVVLCLQIAWERGRLEALHAPHPDTNAGKGQLHAKRGHVVSSYTLIYYCYIQLIVVCLFLRKLNSIELGESVSVRSQSFRYDRIDLNKYTDEYALLLNRKPVDLS